MLTCSLRGATQSPPQAQRRQQQQQQLLRETSKHTGSALHTCAQVPEFRVSYSITTDKLDVLYRRLKPKGVTMSALLAKATGLALAKHPIMFAGKLKSCTAMVADIRQLPVCGGRRSICRVSRPRNKARKLCASWQVAQSPTRALV